MKDTNKDTNFKWLFLDFESQFLLCMDYYFGSINSLTRQTVFKKNKFPSRMKCGVIEPMEEKSRLLRVSLFIPRISPSFLSEITGPCSSCALRQISELLDAVRHQPGHWPACLPAPACTHWRVSILGIFEKKSD